MRYRNVSSHLEDLTGGRAIDPGEYVELNEEDLKDEYNKSKISDGILIEAPEEPETRRDAPPAPTRQQLQKRAAELNISGTSTMRNDELQTAINHAEEEDGS